MLLSGRGCYGSHHPQLRSVGVGGRLILNIVRKEIYRRSNTYRVQKRKHVRNSIVIRADISTRHI